MFKWTHNSKTKSEKQYESFNYNGGLNELDYEAIAGSIERAKQNYQENELLAITEQLN